MPMSRTAPMIHEMMAAGPAASDACSAPSSQPDPMTEPAETMKSGSSPTSRRSLGGTSERPFVLIPVFSLPGRYLGTSDAWQHPDASRARSRLSANGAFLGLSVLPHVIGH